MSCEKKQPQEMSLVELAAAFVHHLPDTGHEEQRGRRGKGLSILSIPERLLLLNAACVVKTGRSLFDAFAKSWYEDKRDLEKII